MFKRLRTLFDGKPKVGDLVTVLEGPNKAETGTIVAVDGAQATVYFDEWNQPALPLRVLERVRGRGAAPGAPHPAGTDLDYEEARTRIRQIPPPMQ